MPSRSVETRSVSLRTVLERERATAARAAETQRTVRRALPRRRRTKRGLTRQDESAIAAGPTEQTGDRPLRPRDEWQYRISRDVRAPWDAVVSPQFAALLVDIGNLREAVDAEGGGDGDGLQTRGVGFHRGHLDADGNGPGAPLEHGRPFRVFQHVVFLRGVGEAAEGELVGEDEGIGAGRDRKILAG